MFRIISLGLGLGVSALAMGASVPVLRPAGNQVPRHHTLEFQVDWPKAYTNPYNPAEVRVDLEVTSGKDTWRVPAFWAQDFEWVPAPANARGQDWFYPRDAGGWRARFAPLREGTHSARVVVQDAAGQVRSAPVEFTSTPSDSPGYVRVSKTDPRFFEFTSGKPFFAVGENVAFIGDQQYVSVARAGQIFARLSENGANHARIWTGCGDWAMGIEAPKNAFARSWDRGSNIVASPDNPERKCAQVTSVKPLRVEPSHRVALRPSRDYILKGRWRSEGATVKLDAHGQSATLQNGKAEWVPFSLSFTTGPKERWLGSVTFSLQGSGRGWVSDLSLKESAGGAELLWEADPNRPARGVYNQLDAFWLDEVVRSAEKHGIYLQLCLLTRDLYMKVLKSPDSPEYARCIEDAQQFLRYAVARWGASTAVSTWEYWNEMDPGMPTDKFYTACGEFLREVDIYQHLRSTSTWGPSARDCRHPALDYADTHFYLRPDDAKRLHDEVHAIQDRARWLRENAPAKPAILGEFGIADNQWRLLPEMNKKSELVDIHNALWASALSGLSGTGMSWWWERLDQQDVYPLFKPLTQFIAEIPWTTGNLRTAQLSSPNPELRLIGLQSRDTEAWAWLFHTNSAWKHVHASGSRPNVESVELKLSGLQSGQYTVKWFDTWSGTVVREDKAQGPVLEVRSPAFQGDIAVRIKREP